MGGGLMQIVANGPQDNYLTGNPQITFFKVVYRRHTNFSIESVEQEWNENNISFNNEASCTIDKTGDLIHKIRLQFNPNNLRHEDGQEVSDMINGETAHHDKELYEEIGTGEITSNFGHTLLKEIKLFIGGTLIDKHYGHWLTTWSELTQNNPNKRKSKVNFKGGEPNDIHISKADNKRNRPIDSGGQQLREKDGLKNLGTNGESFGDKSILYDLMSFNHKGHNKLINIKDLPTFASIPLQFWFCRNIGLSLPLLSLYEHDVNIRILFAGKNELFQGISNNLDLLSMNPKLWVDYIYLDELERRRFINISHEYLIEQLQFEPNKTINDSGNYFEFNLNYPVKELIFTGAPNDLSAEGVDGGATPTSLFPSDADFKNKQKHYEDNDGFTNIQLKLNGQDRFAKKPLSYFTRTQIYQYHKGNGGVTIPDSIGVYSFSLNPEDHQPSGVCNFSKIDNSRIHINNFDNSKIINLYAINYNILRISSGTGSLITL